MTFEQWFKALVDEGRYYATEAPVYRAAWEAAALAERERCAKVCGDLHSHYGVHDYHGLLLEASRVIRNPSE